MPLTPGARFGPYEVVSLVGAGGMGEVYRARDSKLRRDIALKILPAAFAADPERRARFTREAQVLAALNHPHIAAIYGVEEADGVVALVLELVEGPTLDARLAEKPVPIAEALALGAQIADALDAAHEKGIVHRDLKPANVKLTDDGRVKVLDFGLAKALVDPSSPAVAQSPTMTAMASRLGVIVGTAAYMSPEQAKGKAVDKRTDIWAFGCVLYELLTGRRAFEGEDVTDFVVAVTTKEPEWAALPASTPPRIVELMKRCLKKDPRERLRDIGDARVEIADAISRGPLRAGPEDAGASITRIASARGITLRIAGAALAFLVIGGIGGAWLMVRRAPPSTPPAGVIRFPVSMSSVEMALSWGVAVSPDGRHIAFAGYRTGERSVIWLRSLDDLSTRAITGTENGFAPFWSPDGAVIGFFADGKIKKTPVAGGPVEDLCDAAAPDGQTAGAAWNADGSILFSATSTSGLRLLPASGGPIREVTTPDARNGERGHGWPQFLPDGRHFLYTVVKNGDSRAIAYVGSTDSTARTQLMPVSSKITYVPDGYVVFDVQRTMMAQHFDPESLALHGSPMSLKIDIGGRNQGFNSAAAVAGDTLAYLEFFRETALGWFDRAGSPTRRFEGAGEFGWPAMSPVDRRVAIDRFNPNTKTADLWFVGDEHPGARLTIDPADETDVVWSPDGRRVAFAYGAGRELHEMTPGTAAPERVVIRFPAGDTIYPTDWSADGRFIAYTSFAGVMGSTWLLRPDDPHKPVPLLVDNRFAQHQARFSPDGRWIAYASDETGQPEVYVRAMPPGQEKLQVSARGGAQPMWRQDGKELFYVALDNMLTAVPMRLGTSAVPGTPSPLFRLHIAESLFAGVRNHYVPTADGKEFFVNSITSARTTVSVVLNWKRLIGS